VGGLNASFLNLQHFYVYVVGSLINKQYISYSSIVSVVKMESVPKITISGPKMMVKSCLNFFILETICPYFIKGNIFSQNYKFINKKKHLWQDFKINFSKPLFTIIFRPKY